MVTDTTTSGPREIRIEGDLDPGTYDLALRIEGDVVVGALRFLETCRIEPDFVEQWP